MEAVRSDLARTSGHATRARNIPRSLVLEGKDAGEIRKAKDDGRLPMQDHNTRIVVIAADPDNASYVAEAIAREAFHNVTYFAGTERGPCGGRAVATQPPNKELKLTKPSIMELRSLTPVFDRRQREVRRMDSGSSPFGTGPLWLEAREPRRGNP